MPGRADPGADPRADPDRQRWWCHGHAAAATAGTTLPPTDSLGDAAPAPGSDAWRLVLLALAGTLAAALLLTPAGPSARTAEPRCAGRTDRTKDRRIPTDRRSFSSRRSVDRGPRPRYCVGIAACSGPVRGYQDLGAARHRNAGAVRCGLRQIGLCKGGRDQYHPAPSLLTMAALVLCRLVLTPGTQRGRGPQPSSAPIGATTAASAVQGAASQGDRRVSTDLHIGRGTGREIADVSGTLVCDERADTQESDPAVDRAVLVLVGAAVGAAGDAAPSWPSTTKASSSSTATSRQAGARRRLGWRLRQRRLRLRDGLHRPTPINGDADKYFTGGDSKDVSDIPDWHWTTISQPQDKNDIAHAFAAAYNDGSGDAPRLLRPRPLRAERRGAGRLLVPRATTRPVARAAAALGSPLGRRRPRPDRLRERRREPRRSACTSGPRRA